MDEFRKKLLEMLLEGDLDDLLSAAVEICERRRGITPSGGSFHAEWLPKEYAFRHAQHFTKRTKERAASL